MITKQKCCPMQFCESVACTYTCTVRVHLKFYDIYYQEFGVCSHLVQQVCYRLDGLEFKSWYRQKIISSSKCQTGLRAHPAFYSVGTTILSWGYSDQGMVWSTQLHLASRLRMSGTIPLLPLYAFMAWAGTTFPHNVYQYIYTRLCI